MKVLLLLVLGLILGCGPSVPGPVRPYGSKIFVRGNFFKDKNSDDTTSWAMCDDRNEMKRVGAYDYELSMSLKPGTYNFKIGDKTWKAVSLGVPKPKSGRLEPGKPEVLLFADGTMNLEIRIPTSGTYRFYLDAADRLNPVLTIAAK